MSLEQRMRKLGTDLGERELQHAGALETTHKTAEHLRGVVAAALEAFHAAAAAAGAPHVRVALGEPRLDDKHIRAVEFDLLRGRHRAIVTVKSRGDVTLVGPFRVGKTEGPCRSFPVESMDEIEAALGDFLESFIEEGSTP